LPVAIDGAVRDYYRYPTGMVDFQRTDEPTKLGFFRFESATCFGASTVPDIVEGPLGDGRINVPDATEFVRVDPKRVCLPFNPSEIADNLRLERYSRLSTADRGRLLNSPRLRQGYYAFRKLMPVSIRKYLQRVYLADWRRIPFPSWPVDCTVELLFEYLLRLALKARAGTEIPFVWFWPDGHRACLIMTHDVEEAAGRDFCSKVMDLDAGAGLRSSFQIVPEERYRVPHSLLDEIRSRGHEVNVHDLNHDGRLFEDWEEFRVRAAKIRAYARELGSEGFRSAVLYRNSEWLKELCFSYDLSVPNVAHLEPQRGGCCTVMPYFIGETLELPLTTTQDYSLFHILQQYSLCLWEKQLEIILAHYGLVSFNVHPDYIVHKSELAIYEKLLSRLASLRAHINLWAPLPRELNSWWRQRSRFELMHDGKEWKVVGEGSERASVAYASFNGERLAYRLEGKKFDPEHAAVKSGAESPRLRPSISPLFSNL
jgi:hypothetical protein